MKMYIVGSVASGKSTFAKKTSNRLGVECTHLDGIVHIKDKSNRVWGNVRRTDDEISQLFKNIIDKPQWIIEDSGRKCFSEGMENADIIIYLKPSVWVRRKRIITRYVKQKLGLEDCLYTPSLLMLKFMFKTLNNYESGKDDLDNRLSQYKHKTIAFKKNKEINEYLLNFTKL